jgi:hypothetical protein
VSVAERDPATDGLKATEIVQLDEAARLVPQVLLEMRKSAGSAPVIATLLMVRDELVLLVRVVVSEPVVVPTETEPNEREVGLMLTEPVDPPGAYPDSATVWGEFVAESLKLSEAVRVPLVVGAKATLAEQLAAAASVEVQVFE